MRALLFREKEFLLVESIAKKCKFLEDVSQALQLPNVVVCNERVENLSSGYRNRYDIVTVRAVTNLSQLWKWAVPLLKTNAFMLTWKKYNTPEIEDLKSSVRKQKMIRVLTPENDFGLERIKETRIIKVIKL